MRWFAISLVLLFWGCTQELELVKTEGLDMKAIQIIPQPDQVLPGSGVFKLDRKIAVVNASGRADLDFICGEFAGLLNGESLLDIKTVSPGQEGRGRQILLRSPQTALDSVQGSYRLLIDPDGIVVESADRAGFLYAYQTLRQLLPPGFSGESVALPAVTIEDSPRFQWRGMHLDVSRHFFPVEFVKRYLDIMALHKLNVFHWHLTDDNGWRIEIDAYPELTEISAWRVDQEHLPWRERTTPELDEKATYGGFYTKEEIRDVIAYAAEREIMVVPEVEMPGHTSEVFAAFPELSCRGERLPVAPGVYWPNKDIFCAGNDSVFIFLETILTEVAELFPTPYLHIGGDEAHKERWKVCPKCQARIKEEGLADEAELQSWFIHRIEEHVLSLGKRMIGWDEILEGGLAPSATVMSWRNEKGGITAANMGHDAIMCPNDYAYFDHYQGPKESEPEAIGGFTDLAQVYGYDPMPEEIAPEKRKHILGAQANLWTEFIPNGKHAEYMVLPRMAAQAEIVWTEPEAKDYDDFRQRVAQLVKHYEAQGWNYRPLDPES